jgi:23S rRNA (adenine-N6)-dimethyltransferase
MEFGAGYGRLTEQLAARAGRVIAVEVDSRLAARLASRFATRPNVTVVSGDALAVALPRRPFRVVSNPPFAITAPLLRRLLDDSTAQLERADLVLGWGAALALTGVFEPAHRSRRWHHRYEFLLIRRLPAACFDPAPETDAALVSIRRTPVRG